MPIPKFASSFCNLELEDNALVLSVNSRKRSDRGRELLATILGRRVGSPSVRTESFEQIVASHKAAMAPPLDIPEVESCAIIHDQLDRHYRGVLDQPVPMLEGQSLRAAVGTDGGRNKVADWLKMPIAHLPVSLRCELARMRERASKGDERRSAVRLGPFIFQGSTPPGTSR